MIGKLVLLSVVVSLLPPAALAQSPEVVNLRFEPDEQTLAWDPEPSAVHYNVYRGYLHDLDVDFFGTTMEPEVPSTSVAEPTEPSPGRGFFYLVTAVDAVGEGTLGLMSDGLERPNHFAWPGFAIAGDWQGPSSWPVVAIHSVVLRTGKVLIWEGGGSPTTTYTWDPVSDTHLSQRVFTNLFCSGHSFLPDGRVMVTGGTVPLFNGRSTTWLFDPDAESWTQGPYMRKGRYYPTNTTLGDGTILTFSGNDENGVINPDVERYYDTGQGSWDYIIGADKTMTLYPAMHLLPDGTVFHSGPEVATEKFDPLTATWSFVANSNFGKRAGGSGQFNSVMLPPGHEKIMILGGNLAGQPATNTTEIIDLAAATPVWNYGPPMNFPRMHGNVTILPDGTVLATGGGVDGETTSHPAEIYDPQTAAWTVGAMMKSFRLYHSTAVLMPDGRVLQAGSNDNPTAEIFSPGYLFRGPRPTIDDSPAWVRYGRTFDVSSVDAANIAEVVWIRPSSTTHSKNMAQRYLSLPFTASSTTLTVTAPSSQNVAPPGYYMMFLLDVDGVPSVAAFIQVK